MKLGCGVIKICQCVCSGNMSHKKILEATSKNAVLNAGHL